MRRPSFWEHVAQSVEHLTFNEVVAGSIPAVLTKFLGVRGKLVSGKKIPKSKIQNQKSEIYWGVAK